MRSRYGWKAITSILIRFPSPNLPKNPNIRKTFVWMPGNFEWSHPQYSKNRCNRVTSVAETFLHLRNKGSTPEKTVSHARFKLSSTVKMVSHARIRPSTMEESLSQTCENLSTLEKGLLRKCFGLSRMEEIMKLPKNTGRKKNKLSVTSVAAYVTSTKNMTKIIINLLLTRMLFILRLPIKP